MKNLEGRTFNVVQDNVEKLKELFPEIITEDKIDIDKLRIALGENIEKEKERYEFTWNGKTEAVQLAQKQTTGTLRPSKEESVNWESTQNLYIEGDNLEVLRVLQNSYRNKVKIIYIDPPYNTGKDFIYKDDFHDNVKNYKERLNDNMKSNSEVEGRYHTNWLNMIYPRLKLARNLLMDDGVIFISIDDNEEYNLRKICNEIYGENNYVGTITWEKRTKAQNTKDAKDMFQSKTEYILIYKKNISKIRFNLEKSGEKEYDQIDEKGQFRYKIVEEMSSIGMRGRQTMIYPIKGVMPSEGKQWKIGFEAINDFIKRDDLVLLNNRPYIKIRPFDEDSTKYFPFWSHFFDKDAYGTAETGKAELTSVLETSNHGFETVKPVTLIKKLIFHVKDMIKLNIDKDDIILDFFSGSSTTAHAVLQMNAEDNGSRKFIMVQIPEPIDKSESAYKAGYKNICEIGKERIRRAGQKIINENKENQGIEDLDVGFKVFKLDETNLKQWDEETLDLKKNLLDLVEPVKEDRNQEDVVYEILLKYGVDLTYPIEEMIIARNKVYSIGMGYLFICLENNLKLDQIEEIAKQQPSRIVFYDKSFKDDTTRTNAQQILKRYGVEDIRVI